MLRPIYQERASLPETLSVILVEKRWEDDPITDTFDELLLIITANNEVPIFTKHYTDGQRKSVLHVISEKQLTRWLLLGTKRKVNDWIVGGKLYFDRDEYGERLKEQLESEPLYARDFKMGIELAKVVRSYIEGKTCFEQKNYMDAYYQAATSLQHLARLAAIKQNILPETTVWTQMKKIEPAVYKLYEELIESNEKLDKRLDLLFLASEFFIYNYTSEGANHLLNILKEKDSWSIQELHDHEELAMYSTDLEFFIEYLVGKHLIEVVQMPSKNEAIFHREYKVAQTAAT